MHLELSAIAPRLTDMVHKHVMVRDAYANEKIVTSYNTKAIKCSMV